MKYPKYSTTVVGAHSVPDWFEALDRLVAVGQLALGAMADAQYRTTQAAQLSACFDGTFDFLPTIALVGYDTPAHKDDLPKAALGGRAIQRAVT